MQRTLVEANATADGVRATAAEEAEAVLAGARAAAAQKAQEAEQRRLALVAAAEQEAERLRAEAADALGHIGRPAATRAEELAPDEYPPLLAALR